MHRDLDNRNKLVLRTCKNGDPSQNWNCAKNYIEQADASVCITATNSLSLRRKKSVKSQENRVGKSFLAQPEANYVKELAEELQAVLRESQSDGGYNNDFDVSTTSLGAARMESSEYSLTFETCSLNNVYQKWSIVGFGGDMELSQDCSTDRNGKDSICSTNASKSHNIPKCYAMDMKPHSVVTHSSSKWATCSHLGYYVTGFYHTFNVYRSNNKENGLISGIKCCAGEFVFTGEENTPQNEREVCHVVDWFSSRNFLITSGWFICPKGSFLKGFLLSAREYIPAESLIKRVECCKPISSPLEYMHCYVDVATIVGDTGSHTCHLEGYHITSVYRKHCNDDGRECREEIICCMQA